MVPATVTVLLDSPRLATAKLSSLRTLMVEDVLDQHPLIREVCVIGLPDGRWGERVVAAIVAAPA